MMIGLEDNTKYGLAAMDLRRWLYGDGFAETALRRRLCGDGHVAMLLQRVAYGASWKRNPSRDTASKLKLKIAVA